MSENQQGTLQQLLTEELSRYGAVYVPVKSSLLRRLVVRNVRCEKLHPNPEDEFCKSSVGPSFEIIRKYTNQFRTAGNARISSSMVYHEDDDALIIERIRPDGYIILNGHHRWAAGRFAGLDKLPVKIVNLTHQEDIEASLRRSDNTRRVTLDLDEVVFREHKDNTAEKPLRFPASIQFKEPLRLGVPALFRFLKHNGYDVWVYTSRYASMDYLQHYFRAYHTYVTGIVTGMSRKNSGKSEKLLRGRYQQTIHIDRDTVTVVDSTTKEYQEFHLSGTPASWSQEIMDIVGALKQHE